MSNVGDPAFFAKAVVPADGADLSTWARSLYIGVTGNVTVTTVGGDTVTFNNVPVGVLPVQVKRVFATGTTATNIVALQ